MPLCDGAGQETDIVAQVRRTQQGDKQRRSQATCHRNFPLRQRLLHGYSTRGCRAITLASCIGQPSGHEGIHADLEAGTESDRCRNAYGAERYRAGNSPKTRRISVGNWLC
jgi:hypothetical protein